MFFHRYDCRMHRSNDADPCRCERAARAHYGYAEVGPLAIQEREKVGEHWRTLSMHEKPKPKAPAPRTSAKPARAATAGESVISSLHAIRQVRENVPAPEQVRRAQEAAAIARGLAEVAKHSGRDIEALVKHGAEEVRAGRIQPWAMGRSLASDALTLEEERYCRRLGRDPKAFAEAKRRLRKDMGLE